MRFLQTWNALESILTETTGDVLDVSGIGPIGAFLTTLGWNTQQSSNDLREDIIFGDQLFDLIICTEIIEHIKDQDSSLISDLETFNYSGVLNMLNELCRVLKPNGKLLITTPNACSYITLGKWLHGEMLYMNPDHVREFTPFELERVAKECGLVSHSITTVNSWEEKSSNPIKAIKILLRLNKKLASVERGDNIIALFKKRDT
jgi:SAM-dependent methyltransferase